MGSLLAELAANRRTAVRLSLPELDALAGVAGQHRGSRDLDRAVRQVTRAAERRRAAAMRAAGR